jgi:hypothetical protein
MRRFFENKVAFATVALLFALAFGWNLSHAAVASSAAPAALTPNLVAQAVGPTMPPPPWEEVRVAVGPTMPPPPWEEVRVAVGPTMPPPPWEEVRASL